ncbi:MAG: hypothetical protein LC802_19535 [Acidobacteria bacterium]|nr:hypothetical protein [Acidobacteriota bacterium]
MTHEEIIREIASLPPEGQRQVAEFIAQLRQHYEGSGEAETTETSDLRSEGFIGMWRDRDEMSDSSAWVRGSRAHEWAK